MRIQGFAFFIFFSVVAVRIFMLLNTKGRATNKVAMLFLVYDEIVYPGVWNWWLKDAAETVNTYVHWSIKSTTKEEMMSRLGSFEAFKGKVLDKKDLETCKWGVTMPCMQAITRKALADPSNSWFVYISGSTLPVKRQDEIHSLLTIQPFSRWCFVPHNLLPFLKHHQWMVLSREHAELAFSGDESKNVFPSIQNPNSNQTASREMGEIALRADDEFLPFMIIEEKIGLRRLIASSLRKCHTQVYWTPDSKLGYSSDSRLPVTFEKIFAKYFEKELSHPDVWFIRKFAANVTLENSDVAEETFQDFLIRILKKKERQTLQNKNI
eukprot:GHVP01036672.1.p1 GENE.GHVP01036672.1~~GHVP01036672.1.p1  ORF type:complete len:324 (-),score=50.02 GHVP01036672.1:82-1053(-)